jgi:hypothetical protein
VFFDRVAHTAEVTARQAHPRRDKAFRCYDVAPWEDAAEEIEPVQDGVDYWLRVAGGEKYGYNAKTGARLEI